MASLNLTGEVKAGETLVDAKHKAGMVPFEGISYVSEPVVTLAIEPKNPQDIPLLLEGLEQVANEDPNLKVSVDKETGEYLLSGMGELHLEVAINELKSKSGLEVKSSSPRVVYMETAEKTGVPALAKSPNKLNSFTIQVTSEKMVKKIEDPGRWILSVDEHRNVLLDCSNASLNTYRRRFWRLSLAVLSSLAKQDRYAESQLGI